MMFTKRELLLMGITFLIMCIPVAILARKNDPGLLPSTAFDYTAIKATKTSVGEKRQFCDNPTKTLSRLEIHETSLEPGQMAHQPHQHPEEELTVVRQGTVEVLVNGVLKRVGPGSVIFQSSNDMHSIKNVGNNVAIYHAIKWRSATTPQ